VEGKAERGASHLTEDGIFAPLRIGDGGPGGRFAPDGLFTSFSTGDGGRETGDGIVNSDQFERAPRQGVIARRPEVDAAISWLNWD